MAMHAMGLLALRPDEPRSSKAIAACFHISDAHLSKIMQRLVKVGLLRSIRGPKGGFTLAKAPDQITLMDVFTAIEGPVETARCPFSLPRCDGKTCVLGDVIYQANRMLVEHLRSTDLKKISKVFLDGRLELPFPAAQPADP
jgi:Rrf2 family protein